MRYTLWTLTITFLLSSIPACDPGETDEPELTASAEEAIVYVDDELDAEGLQRDPSMLDDTRLIDEVRQIAQFAEDHGCDVVGALGGVYLPDEDADGGSFHGRWFKRDRSLGGSVEGIYMPDATDDAEEAGSLEPSGAVEGDWEAATGEFGTLSGDYYRFEAGQGAFLGSYDETDGDAAGMLGGLWYDLEREGGVFFGVWGHCDDASVEIDPESY